MGTLGLVPDAAWTLQLEHLILAVGRVSATTDGSRLLLLHVKFGKLLKLILLVILYLHDLTNLASRECVDHWLILSADGHFTRLMV